MFVNVSSITKQIGNIVVKEFNGILPKMQIVSSGHEPSICESIFNFGFNVIHLRVNSQKLSGLVH